MMKKNEIGVKTKNLLSPEGWFYS